MVTPARWAFLGSAPACASLSLWAITQGTPVWALAAALGYGALGTAGVFLPGLQMHGKIWCRGPRGRGEVALTFDDGPHPPTTRQVLAALAATRHRATFFVLGDKARRHPEVLREIRDAGHGLAIHGDTHDRLHAFRSAARVCSELQRAQDAVQAAAGVRPQLFRPPIGHTSPQTLRGARRAGVTVVGWSGRGYDGLRGRSPERVRATLRASLHEGAILLLHDAAERDDFVPSSLPVLPEIFADMDRLQLTSVPLEAWIATDSSRAQAAPL